MFEPREISLRLSVMFASGTVMILLYMSGYCLSSTITNNDLSSSSSLSKADAALFLKFALSTEDVLFAFLALIGEPTGLLRLEPPTSDN